MLLQNSSQALSCAATNFGRLRRQLELCRRASLRPLLSRNHKPISMEDPPQLSPIAIYTTSVNFILGAGVLGIPYAVVQAGLLSSLFALLLCCGLSMLTCSWLIEVSDRANALQNELSSRLQQPRPVVHADGGVSYLAPAERFVQLREPLLGGRSDRKLDEYRAAYRQWRSGSHIGASQRTSRS